MLNITEDSAIINKTKELCQTILDEAEFKELKQSIEVFLSDEAAKNQYQAVAQKSEAFHQKHHSGVQITDEELAEYEKEREALMNNPVVSGFIDAQEAVGAAQKSINEYVTKTFEFGRMPVADDFQSSCCNDSGCGCG